MSTLPPPEPSTPEQSDRDLLVGMAFRMLGSRADAADAVQEALARWYALSEDERRAIVSPTGWLVTVVSRVCLDVLKSARVRRERYVGPWLPEPLPASEAALRQRDDDPERQAALDESVTTAMLIVLDTMSPAERVAFVLHDVFGYSFAEIAAALGRSVDASRQLAASGRRKARARAVAAGDAGPPRETVAALKDAWNARDIAALIALLDPAAVAVVDGGGLVTAPSEPVHGSTAIAAMLVAITERAPGLVIRDAEVNAAAGLVAHDADGEVLAVISVDIDAGRVRTIYVTRNPTKLVAWRRPGGPDHEGPVGTA